VHNSPTKWHKWLSSAELWYNSSYHSALKCSPFKALYGVDPNPSVVPMIYDISESESSEAASLLQGRQLLLATLKNNLSKAQ